MSRRAFVPILAVLAAVAPARATDPCAQASSLCASTTPASCVAVGLDTTNGPKNVARTEASSSESNQYSRQESSARNVDVPGIVSAGVVRTACASWKLQPPEAPGFKSCGEATLEDVVLSTRGLPPGIPVPDPVPSSIVISHLYVQGCAGSGSQTVTWRYVIDGSTTFVGSIPPNSGVGLGDNAFLVFAEQNQGGGACSSSQGAAVRLVTPAETTALGWISVLACS